MARDPPLPLPVGLPHPSADRAVRRFDARRRSATCRSTTSASAWAADGDWKWIVGAGRSRPGCPSSSPPTAPLGELTADGRRGDRAAGRAAGHRRGRRQGLRGPRLRGAHPGRREPVVRDDRHGQHDDRPATSSRSRSCPPSRPRMPGAWYAGDPGLPRVLDGRVVQARVRPSRGRAAARRGRRPRGPVRRPRASRPGGLDGPHPPAVLVTRRPHPGPGGQGRDHRLRRRPHARPRLSGDPRGAGLRPARGRRTDRASGPASRSRPCASPAAGRRVRPRSS